MSREAADIARRAAEIQQERGHCKGDMIDPEGRVCMWGSLFVASEELGNFLWEIPHDAKTAIVNELRAMGYDDHYFFPGAMFNDRKDTTEQDVAKVLLQLADRLELS